MIAELIKKHEGVRTAMYKDTLGIPTIGVGFNLNRPDAAALLASVGASRAEVMTGKPLTTAQVDALLAKDLAACEKDLKSLFTDYASFPEAAQAVLMDLRFNLGAAGLRKWPKTLASFKAHDWAAAADNIESNKLWRSQVGARSAEDVALLRGIA